MTRSASFTAPSRSVVKFMSFLQASRSRSRCKKAVFFLHCQLDGLIERLLRNSNSRLVNVDYRRVNVPGHNGRGNAAAHDTTPV